MQLPNSHGRKARWQAIAAILLITGISAQAQDGVAGIEQANEMVREYFDTGITLLYAIGAVLGLVGAVKVYTRPFFERTKKAGSETRHGGSVQDRSKRCIQGAQQGKQKRPVTDLQPNSQRPRGNHKSP
ncbi:DUF4134 domain-containing protein [Chitinophaga lutea]|uniref:DUF4134 domain-containing protein n=1 Tax=Chitinophaga lutea TaxID=2488634 RepID=A0A3N4PT29_9BACT|nr:DUF4134 domain-containing protein [Chitinophaga lutea]